LLVEATAGVKRPRLLDCGCGTGTNLELLSQYGTAMGFDLSERGVRIARGAKHRHICQASVAAVPFRSESFDVVTSLDVLYCLPDQVERRAMAEMHRVLRPGGGLIVNVAAMGILRGDHSVLSGELRRYSASSLEKLVRDAGFRVTRLTYTNAVLFPLVAVVRALQRIRGLERANRTRGDFRLPPPPVNWLLAKALGIEASAIAAGVDMPFGSSLLCLARKC
jgi:SAM-dependent methyltransferase